MSPSVRPRVSELPDPWKVVVNPAWRGVDPKPCFAAHLQAKDPVTRRWGQVGRTVISERSPASAVGILFTMLGQGAL